MIRVLVNGALGRMGTEVCKTVMEQKDMDLSGVVDINGADKTIPYYDGGVFGVDTDLENAITCTRPDVVVDFTRPDVVMDNLRKMSRCCNGQPAQNYFYGCKRRCRYNRFYQRKS